MTAATAATVLMKVSRTAVLARRSLASAARTKVPALQLLQVGVHPYGRVGGQLVVDADQLVVTYAAKVCDLEGMPPNLSTRTDVHCPLSGAAVGAPAYRRGMARNDWVYRDRFYFLDSEQTHDAWVDDMREDGWRLWMPKQTWDGTRCTMDERPALRHWLRRRSGPDPEPPPLPGGPEDP